MAGMRSLRSIGACLGALALTAFVPAALSAQSGRAAPVHSSQAASATCIATFNSTLRSVGERVYASAESGSDVQEAITRLEDSTKLARAVATSDAATTSKVLHSLLDDQIADVQVTRHGNAFVRVGMLPALAAPGGELVYKGQVVGSFTLSVTTANSFLTLVRAVSGGHVLLRTTAGQIAGTLNPGPPTVPPTGPLAFHGIHYQVMSFPAVVFPDTRIEVSLLISQAPQASVCAAGSTAQIAAATLGMVDERIYNDEQNGEEVIIARSRIETFPAFDAAVAAANPNATKSAIIGLFQAHIHVVRVRAFHAGKLVYDLGGPHVLAPAVGYIQESGHTVGKFLFAIQDDAGYSKLVQRFTGAQAVLRDGKQVVASDATMPLNRIPASGSFTYGGATYEVSSFVGEAFPTGVLTITLVVPQAPLPT